MGQLTIDNATRFAVESLFLADEEGTPLLVPVVKATYVLNDEGLTLAEEQVPVNPSGMSWGRPAESSLRYEPEVAFTKLATDVVLVGHAHAPGDPVSELSVELRVGPLRKAVRVVGERTWFRSLGRVAMTKPLPFQRMPLTWERAFGGWDRSDADPAKHACDAHNPVGVGFRVSPHHIEEGLRLPNLEDPGQPIQELGQRVPPSGFGFTSPDWHPRAALGGTYDAAWRKTRSPLLPRDFDRRFFNAAPAGLVAPGYLRGDEAVVVTHASPRGRLAFNLPGLPPPTVTVIPAAGRDVPLSLSLDTVIIDTDAERVFLLWRGHVPLHAGAGEVAGVVVRDAAPSSRKAS